MPVKVKRPYFDPWTGLDLLSYSHHQRGSKLSDIFAVVKGPTCVLCTKFLRFLMSRPWTLDQYESVGNTTKDMNLSCFQQR